MISSPAASATARFLAADSTKARWSKFLAGYPQQLNSANSTSSMSSFSNTAAVASAYWLTLAGMLQPLNKATFILTPFFRGNIFQVEKQVADLDFLGAAFLAFIARQAIPDHFSA